LGDILNNLPWQIQVSLASGYAAYLLAYRGIRFGHRAVDTTFITLVFSLVATAILNLLGSLAHPVVSGAVAFFCACAIAILWCRFFRSWLYHFLKWAKVSWTDDDPSALATLSSNSKFSISQIAVELDNGAWLQCKEAAKFSDAPFGPFVIGPNGDVALYLTHEEDKELKTVRDAHWGDRITYVPASRVRRITLRHGR